MTESGDVQLPDGRQLELERLTYPIAFADQARLIELWRIEWTKTDFDWLAAMNGDYCETLTIKSVIGSVDGAAAGTTSVYYPADRPEVSLVGNVLTHPDYRRLQIGRCLIDVVVDDSFAAGCRVCYLGTTRSSRCVYLNCGFDWVSGGVMRRAAAGAGGYESTAFGPGQVTSIRGATWGDLPGVACLVAQPLGCAVIDYPRGLLSPRHAAMERCVSNFPAVWYDVSDHGGAMCVLTGDRPHRVLGFGSLTLGSGPGRRHHAIIDVATHDHYAVDAEPMIAWLTDRAVRIGVRTLQAQVAAMDEDKADWFRCAGFDRVAELPDQLRVEDSMMAVLLFEKQVASPHTSKGDPS